MTANKNKPFKHTVENKISRKLKLQSKAHRSVWMGLGVMGIVGWSVAVPTLLGLLLGVYLEEHYPRDFSWTLNGLIVGLVLGCFSAWHWVSKEAQAINKDENND